MESSTDQPNRLYATDDMAQQIRYEYGLPSSLSSGAVGKVPSLVGAPASAFADEEPLECQYVEKRSIFRQEDNHHFHDQHPTAHDDAVDVAGHDYDDNEDDDDCVVGLMNMSGVPPPLVQRANPIGNGYGDMDEDDCNDHQEYHDDMYQHTSMGPANGFGQQPFSNQYTVVSCESHNTFGSAFASGQYIQPSPSTLPLYSTSNTSYDFDHHDDDDEYCADSGMDQRQQHQEVVQGHNGSRGVWHEREPEPTSFHNNATIDYSAYFRPQGTMLEPTVSQEEKIMTSRGPFSAVFAPGKIPLRSSSPANISDDGTCILVR